MKVSQEYAEALSEVYIILNTMETDLINKIPNKMYKFIKDNKSNEYLTSFKKKNILSKENLQPKARQFLAYLYYTYWCNETEKIEYTQLLKNNDKKHEEMMKEKYNIDNLFKNRNMHENKETSSMQELIKFEKEKTFLQIIIDKIRKIIKK